MANENTKFDDTFVVDCYCLAKDGHSIAKISQMLGTTEKTFRKWLRQQPALQYALERGQSDGTTGKRLMEWVYDSLDESLKPLFEKLTDCLKRDAPVNIVQKLLRKHGKAAKQQLFLAGLVKFNFNKSLACRFVGITKRQLDRWIADDDGFGEIVEELGWHIQNLCESALIGLVKAGETPAVIFANKTLNAERGYAVKKTVEHTGQIDHTHAHYHLLSLDGADLPTDVLEMLLGQFGTPNPREALHLEKIAYEQKFKPQLNGAACRPPNGKPGPEPPPQRFGNLN